MALDEALHAARTAYYRMLGSQSKWTQQDAQLDLHTLHTLQGGQAGSGHRSGFAKLGWDGIHIQARKFETQPKTINRTWFITRPDRPSLATMGNNTCLPVSVCSGLVAIPTRVGISQQSFREWWRYQVAMYLGNYYHGTTVPSSTVLLPVLSLLSRPLSLSRPRLLMI